MSDDNFRGLEIGQRVKIATYGEVVEVGRNYVTVDTDSGDEFDVDDYWDIYSY